jgi:hypothetical protein
MSGRSRRQTWVPKRDTGLKLPAIDQRYIAKSLPTSPVVKATGEVPVSKAGKVVPGSKPRTSQRAPRTPSPRGGETHSPTLSSLMKSDKKMPRDPAERERWEKYLSELGWETVREVSETRRKAESSARRRNKLEYRREQTHPSMKGSPKERRRPKAPTSATYPSNKTGAAPRNTDPDLHIR